MQILQGYIKRHTPSGAVISSRYRGTDCIAPGCKLAVNTNVYYTYEESSGRRRAVRVETEPFDLDD